MMRVRHIMTRYVMSLRDTATLESAAWSLSAARASGAPVRDRAGNLVGVLSKSDFARLAKHGDVAADTTVGEAMTPAAFAIHPDAPAIEAVRLMVKKGVHRLVVIGRPGQVVGIITAMDVMRALVRSADSTAAETEAEQPTALSLGR